MSFSAIQLVNLALAQLKLLDPDISAAPLTVERTLIDAVMSVIAQNQADQYTTNYQFDIDTKVGSDLDRFVGLFGFARQQGDYATGLVTFSVQSPASQNIFIPINTQVVCPASSVTPVLSFNTTANGVLAANTTSVTIPIQATQIGSASNLPANTIGQMSGGFASSVSQVYNPSATTNGDDIESDAELRIRFKNTIFRNVSGTDDQYLALAIATAYGRQANVIGSLSRFIEYLQIPSTGIVNSEIPYAKYTYSFGYWLTNGDTSANEVFYNKGTDYAFTANNIVPQTDPATSVSPTLAILNPTSIPTGSIVLLEHSYTSLNSRNDPSQNILNKVDVYVAGIDTQSSAETLIFPSSTNQFSATTTSPFYQKEWLRDDSALSPTAGNTFQLLTWQPVTQLPTTITVGSMTYYLGFDYFLVHDITAYRSSREGRDGIEWNSTAAAAIAPATSYTITYNWNALPITVNALIDSQKQMSADVLVHGANQRYFNINVVQMYTQGFATSTVNTNVTTALTAFFESMTYGAVIQISDLLDVIHNVAGVDNVRMSNPADGGSYGVQEVAADGVTTLGSPFVNDFALLDCDLPVLNAFNVSIRSQNTFSGI